MEISRARRVTKLWPDALAFRHSDHEQGSLVVHCVVLVPSSARTATSPSSRPVGAARSQGSAGSWTACGWGGGGRVASSVVARRPRKRLPTGQGGAIVMRPATSAGPAGPIALPPARRVQSASRSPDHLRRVNAAAPGARRADASDGDAGARRFHPAANAQAKPPLASSAIAGIIFDPQTTSIVPVRRMRADCLWRPRPFATLRCRAANHMGWSRCTP